MTTPPTLKVIIIGGGLGGLWAALRAADSGYRVDLFSLFAVRRSHSCCAQGGINAVLDVKGENDSLWEHFVDTIKGGDYLADQPPVKSMVEYAPELIHLYDRMGVTFSRTPEGIIDQRLFGGVKKRRTAFAGGTTGQQLLYSVDEQVRRHESEGRITKYENWEFLSLVRDDAGVCCGVVAMNLDDMRLHAFRGDAVVMATGGLGMIWGRSTMSTNSTGAAAARCYQQGAAFANGEFVQFHPTGMLGHDKLRLMSEACRGDGGRIWVPKTPNDARDAYEIPETERFYFLEEWYPTYGNTVPRDVASRAIYKAVKTLGLGVGGKDAVYLDLTHVPRKFLEDRLGGILEMYQTFSGEDPFVRPMKVYPCMHYSMGGLLVGYERDEKTNGMKAGHPKNHATTIPGLYACGECDSAYHGANRLGANSLLSASFSGLTAGSSALAYTRGLRKTSGAVADRHYEAEKRRQRELNQLFLRANGTENPFALHRELGETMQKHVFVERSNPDLDRAIQIIRDLKDRCQRISLDDRGQRTNQSLVWARQIYDMIVLAEVIATGARLRDECRGSHFKPAFEITVPEGKFAGSPEFEEYAGRWKANNDRWLKTTVATYHDDGPKFEFRPVDTSILKPEVPRDYR
jgi:succinate dehydrogenase / fumarate reductase flavoprotein subunit